MGEVVQGPKLVLDVTVTFIALSQKEMFSYFDFQPVKFHLGRLH